MKDREKFVVARKDVSTPGQIKPGKILGKYRQKEFAYHDLHNLAKREGCKPWQVGIFQNGRLLN